MNCRSRLTVHLIALAAFCACAVARADVVAVVSAKSPVGSLSKSQVADIFLGRVHRFPDGSPAVPVDQQEGAAARDQFYNAFTGWTAAQLRSYWAKIIFTGRGQPPATVPGNEIHKVLASDTKAIAYVDRTAVDDSMKVVGGP